MAGSKRLLVAVFGFSLHANAMDQARKGELCKGWRSSVASLGKPEPEATEQVIEDAAAQTTKEWVEGVEKMVIAKLFPKAPKSGPWP